jgi:hypothetical protein
MPAALALVLSLQACSLLLDTDALSSGYPPPGAGDAGGVGQGGQPAQTNGGASSAGSPPASAGEPSNGGQGGEPVPGCEPSTDDISCDGVDQNCRETTSDAACPAGCNGMTVTGNAYMACSISSSFDDAEIRCQAQGMHLLRIDGGLANQRAMQLAQHIGSYVWIGGSNREDEARFEWTDGTAFYENSAPIAGVYQDFGPAQPVADAARRCVELHDSDGFWSNAPCTDTLQFICNR